MSLTNAQRVFHKLVQAALFLSILIVSLASTKIILGQSSQTGSQQSQREIEVVPPGQEKQLYMRVRPEIPLKFKVNNLNSKKWAHDLEIEVTNTSGKPIYFFHFYVTLPEVKGSTGSTVAFWKHYGRGKLLDFSTPLEPGDVPLLPGEKYIFTLSEAEAKAWDHMKEKEGKPEPKKVVIEFQSINFGDGTGYDDAKFVDGRKKLNFNQHGGPSPDLSTASCRVLAALSFPAKPTPVNFFSTEEFDLRKIIMTLPDICGCAGSCQYVKQTFYTCGRTCDPGNDTHPSQTSVGCTDPLGGCKTIETRQTTCFQGEDPLSCIDTVLFSCFTGAGFEDTDIRCGDNIDNDQDGFKDCLDPDCAFTSACISCTFEGGINLGGGQYDCSTCFDTDDNDCDGPSDLLDSGCAPCSPSPIVIDTLGNGFDISSARDGVIFDISATGHPIRVAWIRSDDAWLALDRNGNGTIDNGRELFGNFTPQAAVEGRNGFIALAEFDKAANGGNGDGRISSSDSIFLALRLWRDTNRNGVSEANELQSLAALGIASLDLKYQSSKKVDQYGNEFRYRAKVHDVNGTQVGRWAWDVFITSIQ